MKGIAALITSVKRHRWRYIFSLLVHDVALVSSALFGFLTVLQIIFAAFPWTLLPIVWDVSVVICFAAIAIVIIDNYVLRQPPLLLIADRIEKKLGLKPRWISLAIELASAQSPGSGALKEEVVELAARQLENRSMDIRRKLPAAITFSCALVMLAWLGTSLFLKPRLNSFWDLPLSLGTKVVARITPGSMAVPLHSSITLGCIPQAKGFPSCKVIVTDKIDGAAMAMLLRPDSNGSFFLRRDSISRSFAYQFSLGATVFPAETVFVFPPPTLSSLHIRLIPPAYVGGQPEMLSEGQGNFSAYVGTVAQFSIGAPHALGHAEYRGSHGNSVSFSVSGNQAKGEIAVKSKGSYTFSLTDTFGQKNDSLPAFSIEETPDMLPLVQILKPGCNKELSPALVETLWVEAMDDIGLTRCGLSWRKNSDPPDQRHTQILLQEGRRDKNFRLQYIWDIRDCSLYPGDTLFYWAYARDNNPFDPARSVVSPTFWFRLPTFEEIHERIAEEHGDAENALHVARKKEETLNGTLSNFAKSTKGKQSLSWEQKQIAKDLEESFQAQSDTIAKAALSLKRAIENLKEQGFSGKEIVDKMENIRKALEEIAREYGDSLLFEPLRKNDNTLNMNDLKQSLEKFQKMLPDLSQRLDNALKYLEMLKRDRKIAALAASAEKYGKEESALASSAPATGRLEQQKMLSKKVDNLLSDLSRASDNGNDSALFSKDDLPSLSGVQSMQQSMKADLSKQNVPESGMMNRMSAGLFSMAQDLSDLQSSAMMRKLGREKELLMEMSYDALSMAGWQEQTRDELGTQGSSAQSQQALRQALMKSAEKMNKLSMTSPQQLRQFMRQFDTAAASMDFSLQLLKNEQDASSAMDGSKENLNGLAFSLMQAANALDGQQGGEGGCSGMMCGLQKLSGKQAMINGMTGEILRRMLGGRGEEEGEAGQGEGAGNAATEKARKLAKEAQQAVADELQKLVEKYGKETESGLGKKAEELAEEAKRLADMLQNPRPEIQDRQDRFLSRMLQATMSMHKQDEGKEERKSRSATNIFSPDKGQLSAPAVNDKDTFFRIRQKAFSGNFPESYRLAVKSYFDSLSVLYLHEK